MTFRLPQPNFTVVVLSKNSEMVTRILTAFGRMSMAMVYACFTSQLLMSGLAELSGTIFSHVYMSHNIV